MGNRMILFVTQRANPQPFACAARATDARLEVRIVISEEQSALGIQTVFQMLSAYIALQQVV